MNSFPTCVSTLILNGGLNQVMFLDLVLFLLELELAPSLRGWNFNL
jgi:hypothetical protein